MTEIQAEIEIDKKQELMDKYSHILGDIPLYGSSLLVAMYRRPEKTKGGVYLTDRVLEEDLYQGKVGLVLKMGPYPFDEEDRKYFGDNPPKVGDWVVFNTNSGTPFGLLDKKGDCRFIKERRSVFMVISDPELIW